MWIFRIQTSGQHLRDPKTCYLGIAEVMASWILKGTYQGAQCSQKKHLSSFGTDRYAVSVENTNFVLVASGGKIYAESLASKVLLLYRMFFGGDKETFEYVLHQYIELIHPINLIDKTFEYACFLCNSDDEVSYCQWKVTDAFEPGYQSEKNGFGSIVHRHYKDWWMY